MSTIGIWYKFFWGGIYFLIFFVFTMILSISLHRSDKKKDKRLGRDTKKTRTRKAIIYDIVMLSIVLSAGIYFTVSTIPYAINPDIKCIDGVLNEVSEKHSSPGRLKANIEAFKYYIFDNGLREQELTLHDSCIRKIFPDKKLLEEGERYRVWYEANTKIIMKVEKIE